MPNTKPVNDSRQVTEYILAKAAEINLVRVHPVAALSKGLAGKTLCGYEDLKQAGAITVSDDGNPVMNSRLMHSARERVEDLNLLVISHCEDFTLAAGGAMNEGVVSKKPGIIGISGVSDSIMVLRHIALSELTGAPVHIAHVSTAGSVRAIRDAKTRGVRETVETAPHYFMLTEDVFSKCGSHAKMNPPLGTESDRMAICKGLADVTRYRSRTSFERKETPRVSLGSKRYYWIGNLSDFEPETGRRRCAALAPAGGKDVHQSGRDTRA